LNGIQERFIANGFIRCAGAALGMGMGLWLWLQVTQGMSSWVVALGGVVLGGLLYLAGVIIFKLPEIRVLIGVLVGRLRRSIP
jgi:hypothetical protein